MNYTEYNERFLDQRGTDHLIEELKAYINGIAAGDIDLSNYVTKTELQTILNDLNIDIDLSSYATKEELTQAINGIDLSAYALKSEIPSLNGYATEQYVDDKVANLPSGSTDLSNYYTKSETYSKTEVDNLIPTVTDGKDGKDGYTPVKGVDYFDGDDGEDGQDGYSPTVTVTKEGKVATITCTDKNGTTTATISDGEDGQDGSSSGGGSSSGSGGENNYSTEETAIGTWIDGRTIYRKIISVDLPALSGTNYWGQYSIVTSPCNIQLIDYRILVHGGLSTDTNFNWYWNYIIHGDGVKGTASFSSSNVSTLSQTLEKNKISVFHAGDPTVSHINCYYGQQFSGRQCDFILEYIKIPTD